MPTVNVYENLWEAEDDDLAERARDWLIAAVRILDQTIQIALGNSRRDERERLRNGRTATLPTIRRRHGTIWLESIHYRNTFRIFFWPSLTHWA